MLGLTTVSWLILFLGYPVTLSAGLEEDEIQVNKTIYMKPHSFSKRSSLHLVVASVDGVKGLTIHVSSKRIEVIFQGQDPIEIEKAFQPVLPWDLPYESLEAIMRAHTFYLKQLSDGTFKLDMMLGLLGGGNDVSRDNSGCGREGGYGERGTFGGSMTGGKGFSNWNERGGKNCSGEKCPVKKVHLANPPPPKTSVAKTTAVKPSPAKSVPAKTVASKPSPQPSSQPSHQPQEVMLAMGKLVPGILSGLAKTVKKTAVTAKAVPKVTASKPPPPNTNAKPSPVKVASPVHAKVSTSVKATSAKTAVSNPKKETVHKNSKAYVGKTHVYSIKRVKDGQTHKVGQSAQGVRKKDGSSKRAEQQVRHLNRTTGDDHTSKVRQTFSNKQDALKHESKLIDRTPRMQGKEKLPGNKTNR